MCILWCSESCPHTDGSHIYSKRDRSFWVSSDCRPICL